MCEGGCFVDFQFGLGWEKKIIFFKVGVNQFKNKCTSMWNLELNIFGGEQIDRFLVATTQGKPKVDI